MPVFSKVNVTVAATQLVSENGNRKGVLIRNVGAGSIYLGTDNTVTAANGFELPAGQQYSVAGYDIYWAITAAGVQVTDIVEAF